LYDEPFEGFGPVLMAARDRSNDKNRVFKSDRVIDLRATRVMKDITGKMRPIEASSSHKHEDEAIDMGNSFGPRLIAGPGWMGEKDKDK
jgi:hypothetical protein